MIGGELVGGDWNTIADIIQKALADDIHARVVFKCS